ncbi:DUF1707 domain-containing protein [Solwaraspora sp. WMMD406]|uniref:DUF1707 SHOCT-like domain-containing protein n=1 Tax=Solwaraspora sp. WMMD406 TaxID=3016095 RepID=UPI002417C7EA|nr:DUF1707 domain-containing protein [Solwaraspora sp. WMMD406]MDG4766085.1 DUF1707 domain-containing protein [Solwaraspora sp. WMMD406]
MNVRVGNQQRDQVVALLNEALGEGYLDLAEYERRLTTVVSARTAGELVDQLSDLPPRFHWDASGPVPAISPTTDPAVATRTTVALVLAIVALPIAACYGLGALGSVVAIGLSRSGRASADQRGKAMMATLLGLCGVVLSVVALILLIVVG